MFVSSGAIWGLRATLDHPRKPHEIGRDTTPGHARWQLPRPTTRGS